MNASFGRFKRIIQDTRNTFALYDYLRNIVKPPYDYSDLLRWQWAQAVSALDKLIHDLIRVGMCDIFVGKRSSTAKFAGFFVTMEVYDLMKNEPALSENTIEQFVILKNKTCSYQDPDKIADGLSYIWGENHKWRRISEIMGMDERTVKTELKNISIRRNQIVHEGDYHLNFDNRQTIEKEDVEEVLNFIEAVGHAIFLSVK